MRTGRHKAQCRFNIIRVPPKKSGHDTHLATNRGQALYLFHYSLLSVRSLEDDLNELPNVNACIIHRHLLIWGGFFFLFFSWRRV